MKNPLRDWLRRQQVPFGGSSSREGGANGGVEHLRSGQSLVPEDVAQDSVSLILQGCCESGHPRDAALLRPGDAIDGAIGDRLNMRAIVDSDILRFPRRNIRRLLERWPAMLRPGAPSSLQTARPPAGTKGFGKILCLMPLSEGVPCEEFSSVCAETIAKETAEAVLCIKVDNGAHLHPMEAALRRLPRGFQRSLFSTSMAEAVLRICESWRECWIGQGSTSPL